MECLQGIRGKQRLPPACHGNPETDTDAKILPRTLDEAIIAYEADAGKHNSTLTSCCARLGRPGRTLDNKLIIYLRVQS